MVEGGGTSFSRRPAHDPASRDASMEGWGAHMQELVASGVWTQDDQDLHINLLEMRSVLLLSLIHI